MRSSERLQSMTSGSMLANSEKGERVVLNPCDRWHVSASSRVIRVCWRYLIINVSVVSFCRWLVIEIPGWMLKTKSSLLCAFLAARTEGWHEADARCVAGCIFRHTVLLRSPLFWELWAVLPSAEGPAFLQ